MAANSTQAGRDPDNTSNESAGGKFFRHGTPLTEEDYLALEKCWISRELADQAGLRRVDTFEGREIIGEQGTRDCAGITFPFYWPGDPGPYAIRLRRDHPDTVTGRNGKPKIGRKYLDAPGARNRLYVPPGVTLEQLANVTISVVITEGEKKALALWRLANYGVTTPRFIPVAITGVWNWRGRVGIVSDEKGQRVSVKGPIPDLARILRNERTAYIVFDVNVHTDESVKRAKDGLAREWHPARQRRR